MGVSSAASVRHFSDKAEFLAALATDGFRELGGIRRRIVSEGGDLLNIAYRMMNAYVEFADAHQGLFALMACAEECGWTAESLPFVSHGAWAMEHGLATLILSGRVPRSDVRVDVVRWFTSRSPCTFRRLRPGLNVCKNCLRRLPEPETS